MQIIALMFQFLTPPPRCCPCLRHGLWVMPAVVSSDKPRYLGGGDGEPADSQGGPLEVETWKGKIIHVLSCIIFIHIYVYYKYIYICIYICLFISIQTTIFLLGEGTWLFFLLGLYQCMFVTTLGKTLSQRGSERSSCNMFIRHSYFPF